MILKLTFKNYSVSLVTFGRKTIFCAHNLLKRWETYHDPLFIVRGNKILRVPHVTLGLLFYHGEVGLKLDIKQIFLLKVI